jgi:hypothetical protein
MQMANTSGEQCFEEYLASLRLKWDYELPAGGKNADYVVHHTSTDVVCEVKDLEPGDIEERARRSRALTGIDSYPRIREKINSSRRQLQPYKDKLPCLLVLFNAGAQVPLSNTRVAGAMFGDLGFALQVGEPESLRATYLQRGKLRPQQNTTFSAVAVVERIKPHQPLFDALVAERMPTPSFEMLGVFEQIRAEHPDIDFQARTPRLRVIHNPHAAIRLPPDAFSGPHDEHWTPNI